MLAAFGISQDQFTRWRRNGAKSEHDACRWSSRRVKSSWPFREKPGLESPDVPIKFM
jgi:hypothetical protein